MNVLFYVENQTLLYHPSQEQKSISFSSSAMQMRIILPFVYVDIRLSHEERVFSQRKTKNYAF